MRRRGRGHANRRPESARLVRTAAASVAALLLATGAARAVEPAAETAPPLTFGVFPMLPAARLEAVFAPIAGDLGRALGRPVRFRSAASYAKFAERLAQAEFDVAHVQPFDYVRTAARSGYLPVAARNDVLAAVAVVPVESAVTEPAMLAGRIVAMPPAEAAVALLGKAALLEAGLDPTRDVTLRNFEDHHSCIHQAVIGVAAACFAGIQSARLYEATSGRRLRTIARSISIPQTVFVVHERLPPPERERIRQVLLGTRLEGLAPELAAFLAADTRQPFVPARDADYEVVRRLWRQVEGR